jgi:predicted enzyme related to lactoylglutathione lyase
MKAPFLSDQWFELVSKELKPDSSGEYFRIGFIIKNSPYGDIDYQLGLKLDEIDDSPDSQSEKFYIRRTTQDLSIPNLMMDYLVADKIFCGLSSIAAEIAHGEIRLYGNVTKLTDLNYLPFDFEGLGKLIESVTELQDRQHDLFINPHNSDSEVDLTKKTVSSVGNISSEIKGISEGQTSEYTGLKSEHLGNLETGQVLSESAALKEIDSEIDNLTPPNTNLNPHLATTGNDMPQVESITIDTGSDNNTSQSKNTGFSNSQSNKYNNAETHNSQNTSQIPSQNLENEMEILSSRILLRPSNLQRSIKFYRDDLGLAVFREFGEGDTYGIVFYLGGGFLEVSGTGSIADPSISIWLQVRDIKAAAEQLKTNNILITKGPTLEPWGLIEMWVSDPDGVRLYFVEVPDDHPLRVRKPENT